MTLWYVGAAALGVGIIAIGVTVWWFQRGRLKYLASALEEAQAYQLGIMTDEQDKTCRIGGDGRPGDGCLAQSASGTGHGPGVFHCRWLWVTFAGLGSGHAPPGARVRASTSTSIRRAQCSPIAHLAQEVGVGGLHGS